MTKYAYCLLAIFLAGPLSASTAAQTEILAPSPPGLLISTHNALADLDQVCVSLDTTGATYAASHERLAAAVVSKLQAAGLDHVACKTGAVPRLRICVEAISLGECDRSVYRVQTSLSRIVSFTDHRELKVQADVWRLNPVMAAIPTADLAKAVDAAVLTQVEVFVGAYHAAWRFHRRADGAGTTTSPTRPASAPAAERAVKRDEATSSFIASRNSSVFHRADCRWARKITTKNRVTYRTRPAAIQAGRRPCKTCKP
jgi:hypothetical protein